MSERRPQVSWLIGLVLVGMHVRMVIAAGHFAAFGYLPPELLGQHGANVGGAPARFATSILLHETLWQLVYTIGALAVIGPRVEASHGRGATLLFFLIAGTGGAAISHVLGQDLGVGASGGLFGLLAVQAMIPRHRIDMVKLGVLMGLVGFMAGCDNRSHLGGLVVGAALGLIPDTRRADKVLLPIALALLAAIVLADASPYIP